ncbi:HIT family hydrolase, diadenosine tetraphosphate hydrolase [Halobacteroides halobius DSM 5150]|uniref:HIT family hydrolase, diadenosine tetraphosphate hydrolase n=1 Tax=Halobacteroides halobius (strain ATCC 35273 / DSM 5150 / MD-1) TaxID=748449 RepID=L0KCL9_HALHC|nr:histidine triad nucleotide-binding protein [Halobacteroides halobius]AGB41803.1 HIT family hydrolase, diadenosine tetraphosphate hydrolase [Halobacteroides halobius DSM 5150]
MEDCLFCKIVSGDVESDILYEDEQVIAFQDIKPQAPVHLLIVPKKHISTLLDLKEEDNNLVGHIYQVANKLAQQMEIAKDGFRVVSNCKEAGGQTVFHIHYHLLGGRNLQWPPG